MNFAFSEYLTKPYSHCVVFLVLTFLILVLIRPKDANVMYTIAGVVYVFFILTNSVLIYFTENSWSYFFISLLFSVIYILAFSVLSSLYVRLADVDGSGESGMIFLVIIYHPVALLLVMGMKWLIARI